MLVAHKEVCVAHAAPNEQYKPTCDIGDRVLKVIPYVPVDI